jgi:hypothetical protein
MTLLQDLILPEKEVAFEFPGLKGLEFILTYLSKDELNRIIKKCTRNKINPRTRQVENELDDDLFLETYINSVVKDWTGFKFKYLDTFLAWDASSVDPEDEMEYSQENALVLMKGSTVFDNWVSEQIADLGKFMKTESKPKSKLSKDISKIATVA